jgi:hypothetical protein
VARILAGVVSVLLTLGIGALGAVTDDGTTRLSVATPATIDPSIPSTTVVPPTTTSTTVAPATTTTTLFEEPSTTGVGAAPLSPLPTASTTTTTRPLAPAAPAGPTMQVRSAPELGPRGFQVTGTECFGPQAAAGIYVHDNLGSVDANGGGAAMPDGTWSIPVVVADGIASGPVTFKAICVNTALKIFDYPPQTVTLR